MCEAKIHEPDFYDKIWLGLGDIIDNGIVETTAVRRYWRIRHLLSRNDERGDVVKYAQRFSLLLGAQELQVIERTLPQGTCPKGTSLRSVAINRLAECLGVDKKRILDENKRRSHYVSICEQLGPGAVLLLGESDGILSL